MGIAGGGGDAEIAIEKEEKGEWREGGRQRERDRNREREIQG